MFREFFYLQKSDRKVLILLLAIAAIALLVMQWGGEEVMQEDVIPQESKIKETRTDVSAKAPEGLQTPPSRTLFAFDPNTADSTQLLRLGLQPWQVRNIYKYRAAGGVYRKKQDFARLYGLTVKQYRELEPYIRISADYQPASTLFKEETHERDTIMHYPQKLQQGETLDLAHADTTALRRIPGIGSYWARRIVQYGERLGGYVSIDQLQELDEFPTDALPYFVLTASETRKLNINRLSLNELKRHPYIDYRQAKAIVDYRREHGRINDLNDLRLLPGFSPEKSDRLRPYITY